jgi:ParB/RepB/Spo0J family partition protein
MTHSHQSVLLLPLNAIRVEASRRKPTVEAVERLASSMREIDLMTPITVRPRLGDTAHYDLVTGGHRLEAAKALGWKKIDCFVTDVDDANAELWEIDENLMRKEVGAAERAVLTKRRAEIIEATSASMSQVGTSNANPNGRKDIKGVRDAASIREQAEKTGESKSKVARSMRWATELGDETLNRVIGTNLDKGVELEALCDLTAQERDQLVARAELKEKVSARAHAKRKQKKRRPNGAAMMAAHSQPETEHERDLRILRSCWECTCPSARPEFLEDVADEIREYQLLGTPDEICEAILCSLGVDQAKKVVRALDKRLRNVKPDCIACRGTGFVSMDTSTECGMPIAKGVKFKCDCSPAIEGLAKRTTCASTDKVPPNHVDEHHAA